MISERAKRAGLKELEIFDNFEIDRTLPKYQAEKNEISQSGNGFDGGTMITSGTVMISNASTGFGTPNVWVGVPTSNDQSVEIGMKYRKTLRSWLISLLSYNKEKAERRFKRMSIVEFFTRLTGSYKELISVAEIAKYYEDALTQAVGMGQTALLERLKDNLEVVKGEAVLIARGAKKYVTEKQIIEYYEKVGLDKNLKLTWIKNFGRIIPEQVFELKKEIDALKIFDNYVVLHYDPKDEGTKLTKKEIEKKKDPILFGVIRNSKKLYFIADWKDEYCELTLDEMFKVLKGKVLQINNKTVKAYIDKIEA